MGTTPTRSRAVCIKVVFVTGYAENAELGHGHLEQRMHVMTKPFELDALSRRVRELVASPGDGPAGRSI